MRIKLTVQRLHCAWEINLDMDREPSARERATWAAENEHRYHAALQAIEAAPDRAAEITQHTLYGPGD